MRCGEKNYAGRKSHSPHEVRKKNHFGTGYCLKLLHHKGNSTTKEKEQGHWGSGELQGWLETGS
jgi:hypothetical protein